MSDKREIADENFWTIMKIFDKGNPNPLTDEEWQSFRNGICPECSQKLGQHLHKCRFSKAVPD